MRSFDCDLGDTIYPVTVGDDVLLNMGDYVNAVYSGKKIFIVIDEYIHHLYGDIIECALTNYEFYFHIVRAGKNNKTMGVCLTVFEMLDKYGFSRDSLLLAIGGGVVGDLSGFVAGSWYRGMNLIHIPTTLMAAVDSCLGGKTAINFRKTVNAVGSYHHPIGIFIDSEVIKSLPDREISSGLGEVVKYSVIESKNLAEKLLNTSLADVRGDIDYIIYESLRIKSRMVSGDIKEGGKRLYLNFGHTLGHAIEFATVFNGAEMLRHGEGVALGMRAIYAICEKIGYLSSDDTERLTDILKSCQLPDKFSASAIGLEKDVIIDNCIKLVFKDKKRLESCIRLVVLNGVRNPEILSTSDEQLLRLGFESVIYD